MAEEKKERLRICGLRMCELSTRKSARATVQLPISAQSFSRCFRWRQELGYFCF